MSKQLECFIFSDKNKNLRKRTTSLERTKWLVPRAVLSSEVPLYSRNYCFITFSDINECSEGVDNFAVEAECTDTDGSFDCSCNAGFTGSGVNCSG